MEEEELRDHFAGLAMAALIAKSEGRAGPALIVKQAYEYADAMLNEGLQGTRP